MLIFGAHEWIRINPHQLLHILAVGLKELVERRDLGLRLCLIHQFTHPRFADPLFQKLIPSCRVRAGRLFLQLLILNSLQLLFDCFIQLEILLLKHCLQITKVLLKPRTILGNPVISSRGFPSTSDPRGADAGSSQVIEVNQFLNVSHSTFDPCL